MSLILHRQVQTHMSRTIQQRALFHRTVQQSFITQLTHRSLCMLPAVFTSHTLRWSLPSAHGKSVHVRYSYRNCGRKPIVQHPNPNNIRWWALSYTARCKHMYATYYTATSIIPPYSSTILDHPVNSSFTLDITHCVHKPHPCIFSTTARTCYTFETLIRAY